jgi:hypothetical protein
MKRPFNAKYKAKKVDPGEKIREKMAAASVR